MCLFDFLRRPKKETPKDETTIVLQRRSFFGAGAAAVVAAPSLMKEGPRVEYVPEEREVKLPPQPLIVSTCCTVAYSIHIPRTLGETRPFDSPWVDPRKKPR